MARLSINETTTYRWSFEEDVTQYAAAGIPSIGVWRRKVSDYGETKAVELLAETGLKVSHLFWAGGFTGSDGRTFRASVEDASEAIRTARALGAPTLVVYSGARGTHTHNHARRLFRDALKELAPLAADLNVQLAIEPMHPGCAGDFTFLTSLEEGLAMLSAVGHPQVKLLFDTYHLGWDLNVLGRLPDLVPQIALVQLGDGRTPPAGEQNRCRLGEGLLPLQAIVDRLERAGYRGYYDVELLGEDVESVDYRELLQHTREAFARLIGSADV